MGGLSIASISSIVGVVVKGNFDVGSSKEEEKAKTCGHFPGSSAMSRIILGKKYMKTQGH